MTTLPVTKEIFQLQTMISAARELTGLHDFGDMRWQEAAGRWCQAVMDEAPLSDAGILGLQQTILGHLTTRLRITDLVSRHPEILEENVSDPIVVTGLPRTGTTKLQRTLARDPGVQALPLWQLLNPLPLQEDKPGDIHDRMAIAEGMCSQILENYPAFMAGHELHPEEPEEEVFAIEFDTQMSIGRAQIPTYVAWWLARPASERAHVYDYLRTFLQCIQWQDGGRRDRPFVLKSPMHISDMPSLTTVFSGATIVYCHRDIDTTIASSCRILELVTGLYTDRIDLEAFGDRALRMYATSANQGIVDRDNLGNEFDIVDVSYDDIRSDVIGVIRHIWAHRGRTFGPEVERRIAEWENGHPQHRNGRHTYSLDRYGLTSESVHEAFRSYLSRFPAG